MHPKIPLILAAAATALALPTANQTGPNLEKRGHHGWIGSFDNDQCSGTPVGPRPEIHLDTCTAFSPISSATHFGIFFGTGPFRINTFWIYDNPECDTDDTNGRGNNSPKSKADYTDNDYACVSIADFGAFSAITV